jgi:hypothetical protein
MRSTVASMMLTIALGGAHVGCTDDTNGATGTGGAGGASSSGAGGVGGTGTTGTAGGAGEGAGGRDCPDTVLPGTIPGVEPESMANHEPIVDGNGNLYRMVESPSSDGNQPVMMLSTDGGATWAEVDEAGRPSATDLEGTYQLQVGTSAYFSVTRGYRVWFFGFNTSDATSMPDSWLPTESVDENLTSGGVTQYSSLTQTSDGQFWLFYSDIVIDGRQQIAFRRRTGVDTYGAKAKVGDESGDWTGPRALVGRGDVTHLFYEDQAANELLWRTLSASGTLSDATRIDSDGTSAVPVPHANPIFYESGGQDVIVVAFTGADDMLKSVTITDGVVGPEEQVSSGEVLQDADVVANEGAVAHLALQGSTVHAVWSDANGGGIKHSFRPDQGSWSGEQTLWSAAGQEALYVYCAVLQDGCDRLACTYDVGPHGDDTGNIEYTEVVLP